MRICGLLLTDESAIRRDDEIVGDSRNRTPAAIVNATDHAHRSIGVAVPQNLNFYLI